MSETPRQGGRHRLRAALVLTCALLVACTDSPRDSDLLQLFWTEPQNLLAVTRLPSGIGIADTPVLVLSLSEAPESPLRILRLPLQPVRPSAPISGSFRLNPKDHRRFLAMQERVVASLGSHAMVNVGLEVAYCAQTGVPPAKDRPVAELMDSGSGRLLMVRPSAETARSLQERLPAC